MAAETNSKKKNRKRGDAPEPRADDGGAEAPVETEPTIEALQERCADLEAMVLRAQADFQNLRRRGQSELEAALKREMQPLLEELLLVLDFLDMALAIPVTSEEAKNLAVGVEMTRTKLLGALEASGVKAVPTTGTFDPKLHDAAEAIEAEGEPGTILETVRRGFRWHELVLRPARVKVVAGSAPATEREPRAAEPEDSSQEQG